MSKKNIILSTLLLCAIVFPCFLSISTINTSVEIDDEQNNTNVNILSTPKSSGYAVTKKWNHTSGGIVNTVAVSDDGKYIAVGTEATASDEEVFLFDTSDHDGQPVWSYETGCDIDKIAISSNGSYIAAASESDNKVFLLNNSVPESGQSKKEVWIVARVDTTAVDISEDGQYIVVGYKYIGPPVGEIFVYNNSYEKSSKKDEYLWKNSTDQQVNSVAISADGDYIVAGTTAYIVFFWNNTDYNIGEEHAPMWSYDTTFDIYSLSISANGSYIVVGGAENICLFNKSAEGVKKPEWNNPVSGFYIISVAISEDNSEYIAAGGSHAGDGGWVYLFNRSDYKGQQMWKYESPRVKSVAITGLGDYIVAGTQDFIVVEQYLYLFNKSEGGEGPEWFFDTPYECYSVSMSSSGNYIAAGGNYTSTSGRTILFYHGPSSIFPLGGGGDDDDAFYCN